MDRQSAAQLRDMPIGVPEDSSCQQAVTRAASLQRGQTDLIKALHLILWCTNAGCKTCDGVVQTGIGTSMTASISVSTPSSSLAGVAAPLCVGVALLGVDAPPCVLGCVRGCGPSSTNECLTVVASRCSTWFEFLLNTWLQQQSQPSIRVGAANETHVCSRIEVVRLVIRMPLPRGENLAETGMVSPAA